MERLISELKSKIIEMKNLTNNSIDLSDKRLDGLYSVYPFNKFEYVISHLIATNTITLEEYLDIRNSYLERNRPSHIWRNVGATSFERSRA